MSATVSTRWFWSDWMSDPGLRACGYAARGLWKDMLCIAGSNKGRDYGYVVLNSKPLDAAGIAKQTGGAVPEVEVLLEELKKNGVYNIDRRKAIYCRRMVRAQKSRRNGRVGGNPKLLKTERKEKQDNRPLTRPRTRTESGSEVKDTSGDLFSSDWPRDYQSQFWVLYPRRVAKAASMRALDRIRKAGTVSWAALIAGVLRYARWAQQRGEPQFVKHPATWLNGGCWDDEDSPPTPGAPAGAPRYPPRGGGFAEVHRMLREGDDNATDASAADHSGTVPAKNH